MAQSVQKGLEEKNSKHIILAYQGNRNLTGTVMHIVLDPGERLETIDYDEFDEIVVADESPEEREANWPGPLVIDSDEAAQRLVDAMENTVPLDALQDPFYPPDPQSRKEVQEARERGREVLKKRYGLKE